MSSWQLPPPPTGPAPQSHPSETLRGDPHADRRLRVFIGSTLQELAPERIVVREAVLHRRLAPVMFELGARPHPPRDLYRASPAQTDLFAFVRAHGDRRGTALALPNLALVALHQEQYEIAEPLLRES